MLNDIDICKVADDTTTYIGDVNLEWALKKLEEKSELAVTWFEKNYIELNTDKYNLII